MSCFLLPCARTFVGIQEKHRVSFSLLQCPDSMESHLASIHLSRQTIAEGQLAYLGEGWPSRFRRVDCHANVHMRASTGTHMRGSGVPEQPVNIQHFIGVLVVGARNGQRANTRWILKWLKPYTQMYVSESVQTHTCTVTFLYTWASKNFMDFFFNS